MAHVLILWPEPVQNRDRQKSKIRPDGASILDKCFWESPWPILRSQSKKARFPRCGARSLTANQIKYHELVDTNTWLGTGAHVCARWWI